MKIVQAELQMASSHQSMQRQEVRETLRAWIGDQRPDFDRPPSLNRPEVTISAQGKHLAEQTAPSTQTDVAEPIDEPHLQLMRLMIEALTGRPARIFDARELALPTGAETTALPPIARQAVSTPRAGFGLEYERHEIHAEQEVTQFSAVGVVKTADGREIHFPSICRCNATTIRKVRPDCKLAMPYGKLTPWFSIFPAMRSTCLTSVFLLT